MSFVNPFLSEDQPPGDHELTLFLGPVAGRLQEILVSLIERGLDPTWFWFGPVGGWGLQAHTSDAVIMTLRGRQRPITAYVAFPAEAASAVATNAALSLRARRLVPIAATKDPVAMAVVDIEEPDGIDVLLELIDARTAILEHGDEPMWS